eukprot:NODE_4399_length_1173_cov_47.169524_g3887_i0.p1 GENE.NODE_4399_length_1173_cov_47.169524_g3887_i0~~NODE_4399_length_1173_cov_47.169524_g3887_i0.p1  ORF type:complete len:324 (+),score=73.42 NODE_4399_length_1173_cov_47.169524_g3887_i0:59-1030(+)
MSEPDAKKAKVECPYDAKEESAYTATTKSYKNLDFLNGRAARAVRIMCEFEEPLSRLRANNVAGTILIFGSRRAMNREEHEQTKTELETSLKSTKSVFHREQIQESLDKIKKLKWMCELYEKAEELSKKITTWTMSDEVRSGKAIELEPTATYLREGSAISKAGDADHLPQQYVVCTAGGSGLMKAANKGASEVDGARNMGMSSSLEETQNPYVTPDLAFEFHYFFTQKFWMLYQAVAIVVFPGGFETCDSLFEVLTLKQTGKMRADLPIVLFGSDYWSDIFNWQEMANLGTISQSDVDNLFITNEVNEAYEYIVNRLTKKKI